MLKEKAIDALQAVVKNLDNVSLQHMGYRRNWYELLDLYLQKESNMAKEKIQGEIANIRGDKTKLRDMEIPLAFIQKDTALAFLVGTFLTGYPIFLPVANREHETHAAAMAAWCGKDQRKFKWVKHLKRALDDVLRYNVCGLEVEWKTQHSASVKTVVHQGSPITGEVNALNYEGNSFKRLDPYNLVYDTSVEPAEVHERGEFAGYWEMFNRMELKRYVTSLNNLYVVRKNTQAVFESKFTPAIGHYRPHLRKINAGNDGQDFRQFFGNMDPHAPMMGYHVLTLYRRLIPSEHHMRDMPRANTVTLFKLVYVNDILLYAEPLTTSHPYLPIIIGQFYPGGSDVKSFVEYLLDVQDTATALMHGTMNSLRRAVADRALYDPTRIRKGDIESVNPVSKIPVAANVYSPNIADAFHQIPFEDRASGLFTQNMNLMFSLANQTTGQNPSSQGSFIPGNKTQQEFTQIMSNSDARMQLGAINLEESLFMPVKEIIVINYLINGKDGEIDGVDGSPVQVDMAEIRKVAPEFKVADGIMPSTKLANTQLYAQALQVFQSNPEAALEYDLVGITVSMLKQQGATDLDQYKRTPEQQQKYLQMMGLMQGSNNNTGGGNSGQ